MNCPSPDDEARQEVLIGLLDRAIALLRQEGGAAKDFACDLTWLEQRRIIWTNHAWRLALIGITSSGKSTLVNALLGADLLPTGVQPVSNIIICCRRGGDGEPFCRVRYRDRRPPEEFCGEVAIAEKLAFLGDERRNQRNQLGVDEIELFSPALPFSENVILIDTPGLDSYGLQCHEELTLNWLLPSVDAVVFLQTVKSNAGDQLRRILEVIHAGKKPLIFLQTQADAVESKLGVGHTIEKTKDQIKREHRDSARKLIAKAGFPVESTPIFLVSAKSHLCGDKDSSGMSDLVSAVKEQLAKLGPELSKGRFQQLETELKRIAEVNFNPSDIRNSRRRLEGSRRGLSQLASKSETIIPDLQRTLVEKIAATEKKLSETWHEAEKLGYNARGCERAREIIERFRNILGVAGQSLSAAVQGAERGIQDLAKALNLSSEDVTFNERPSRRIPSIRIPKSVREVDEPGFLAGVKRFFGVGGRHHEEHLNADEFRQQFKKLLEDHLQWMKCEAKSAIVASVTERRRAITDEIHRQIRMLDLEESSQLACETRLKVANALKSLLQEMPQAGSTKTQPPGSDEPPTRKDARQDIEVAPLAGTLLRIASRAADYRLLCLRNKALAHVAKRTGAEAARRALIFGYDKNGLERFLNLFWSDVPEEGRKLSEGFADLGDPPPFGSIAVALHNGEEHDRIAKTIAAYLSQPATLFLMVDLEQPGSAMNEIDRSHILEHLGPDVGLVIVVQSIRGMFNAQTLTEGIIHLHEIVGRFSLAVDAVLVNSDETFFTTSLDALFERCGRHATLRDEQDFLASIGPRDAREEEIAKQILRGLRDSQSIHSN